MNFVNCMLVSIMMLGPVSESLEMQYSYEYGIDIIETHDMTGFEITYIDGVIDVKYYDKEIIKVSDTKLTVDVLNVNSFNYIMDNDRNDYHDQLITFIIAFTTNIFYNQNGIFLNFEVYTDDCTEEDIKTIQKELRTVYFNSEFHQSGTNEYLWTINDFVGCSDMVYIITRLK